MRLGGSREQTCRINEALAADPRVGFLGAGGEQIFFLLRRLRSVAIVQGGSDHRFVGVEDDLGGSGLADFLREAAVDGVPQQYVTQPRTRGGRTEVERLNRNFKKISSHRNVTGLQGAMDLGNDGLRKKNRIG